MTRFRDYADAHNSGDYCTCEDVRQGDTRVKGTKIVHSKPVFIKFEITTGDGKGYYEETACGKPIITPSNMPYLETL